MSLENHEKKNPFDAYQIKQTTDFNKENLSKEGYLAFAYNKKFDFFVGCSHKRIIEEFDKDKPEIGGGVYLKKKHIVYNSGGFQLDGIPDGDKEKVAEFVSREFLEGKRIIK